MSSLDELLRRINSKTHRSRGNVSRVVLTVTLWRPPARLTDYGARLKLTESSTRVSESLGKTLQNKR
jgi:hypothetical protein